jgi:hypothetical protein
MILYIHGYNSSPNSAKAKFFKKIFPNFISGSYDVNSPKLAIKQLSDTIKKNNVNFIIGSSLGGLYATILSQKFNIPALLINPLITDVSADLYKHFNLNSSYIEEAKDISKNIIDITNINEDLLTIFLSKNDELLPYTLTDKKFKKAKKYYFDDSHRFIYIKKYKDLILDITEHNLFK